MRKPAFIKQNKARWKQFEDVLTVKQKEGKPISPDEQADLYVQITDDLSYARTFYPKSDVTNYLNELASKAHQQIYRNKKEDSNRIVRFWVHELPLVFYDNRKQLLYAFVFFAISLLIGAVSAANDSTFVRLILGDSYVNMTLENIEKGDPMAVYKDMEQFEMFAIIAANNIFVSFRVFIFGIFLSLGTAVELFRNGIMVGSFQYFFYQKEVFWESFLTIWIHGTLEISAIVIAGAAGFVLGNSILFPKTHTRLHSFMKGARDSIKMIIGLVPIFLVAALLEGYVTRLTDMPLFLKIVIIGGSAVFIVWYFVLYPIQLATWAQERK